MQELNEFNKIIEEYGNYDFNRVELLEFGDENLDVEIVEECYGEYYINKYKNKLFKTEVYLDDDGIHIVETYETKLVEKVTKHWVVK